MEIVDSLHEFEYYCLEAFLCKEKAQEATKGELLHTYSMSKAVLGYQGRP